MRFSFHLEAEAELRKAVDCYEQVESGLGLDFAAEVHNAIQRAVSLPRAWPVMEDGIRRSLVKRFPYGVLYVEERDSLYILAIMHLRRLPGYWKHRRA